MMRSRGVFGFSFAAVLLLAAGCGTTYAWRSSVPERMRTVAVPTFRNESKVTEMGPVMSRQLLREFQREGTFKIRRTGDSALEVQGVVKSVTCKSAGYDRRSALRMASYVFTGEIEISVIDKTTGRVLVNNRIYKPETSLTSGLDLDTAMRDASGRLADDLSQRVVDDVLNLKY